MTAVSRGTFTVVNIHIKAEASQVSKLSLLVKKVGQKSTDSKASSIKDIGKIMTGKGAGTLGDR